MNNIDYESLQDWEKEFYNLNVKLGNDAWGARIESDGVGGRRIRVYVNHENMIEKIKKETNDNIANLPLVFTIYNQEQYNKELRHDDEKKEKNERYETTASAT